ncbi:hypothetical protein JI435_200770, partial [Parastagonospora nodorum SN15]
VGRRSSFPFSLTTYPARAGMRQCTLLDAFFFCSILLSRTKREVKIPLSECIYMYQSTQTSRTAG